MSKVPNFSESVDWAQDYLEGVGYRDAQTKWIKTIIANYAGRTGYIIRDKNGRFIEESEIQKDVIFGDFFYGEYSL